jgi:hypothetical protein
MNAVRTYTQINSLGNIILENLPFKKGEFVEVLVIPVKNEEFGLADEWELLFKSIQNNEVSRNIDDEDITQEINFYRKKL